MNDKKIIFMGTPDIAAQHLNSLIENNLNIISIFTQPPRKKNRGMRVEESQVHKIAKKNNLEIFYPTSIDDSVIELTKSLYPDLIIVVAYGIILPKEFLNIPKYGCINIHVSLLPRWRGAAPIEHALLEGDVNTGISIINISPELDAGDILMQESFSIDKNMYSDDLTSTLTNLGKKTMMKVLPLLFESKITAKKQNENKVTYANKFSSKDRKINFNNSTEEVYNHIRAHGPNPGSWFIYKGERIKILKATKTGNLGEKSTILNKDFMLACNDGSILPSLIQREGKKAVNLDDFLRGFTFSIHDKLNA
jgi:methionyl-tRNA formyltransferase